MPSSSIFSARGETPQTELPFEHEWGLRVAHRTVPRPRGGPTRQKGRGPRGRGAAGVGDVAGVCGPFATAGATGQTPRMGCLLALRAHLAAALSSSCWLTSSRPTRSRMTSEIERLIDEHEAARLVSPPLARPVVVQLETVALGIAQIDRDGRHDLCRHRSDGRGRAPAGRPAPGCRRPRRRAPRGRARYGLPAARSHRRSRSVHRQVVVVIAEREEGQRDWRRPDPRR